jgi:hypothetical protein
MEGTMKKLLISAVILMLSVGSAGAAGLNLAWNNCFPSAGAALDQTFSCDDSSPGAMDANLNVFTMVGSVIPGINITGLIAWGGTFDWQTLSPTLDDWWKLAGTECREGAVTFSFNGFSNTTTCNKTMMVASPAPLPVANWAYPADKPANWARYSPGVARTTGFNVVGTTQYQLCIIAIDTHNTLVNGDGTTVACAGCSDPACIVFNEVELDVPVAQQPPDGKNIVNNADQRQYVTWQGGAIGGTGCPLSTPARRTSWGQVKSLYR